MPRGPQSAASARVRPSTAALAVAYGKGPADRPLGLMRGDVDDGPAGPGGQEPADRGRAPGYRQAEVGHDQAGDLPGRHGIQPGIPEDGRVVHPPGEASRVLSQVSSLPVTASSAASPTTGMTRPPAG
jgi:hypothetical protein